MFQVLVLGTSAAVPAFGRYPSGQVLTHNDRHYLLDCGEGTQFQLQRYRVRLRSLDAIFISHLHGDHIFGLPGLLTSLGIYGRTAPLPIIGPEGIADYILQQFRFTDTALRYELSFTVTTPTSETKLVFETERLWVYSLPLEHRVPTTGYHFVEKPKRPRFLVDAAEALGVPKDYYGLIKQGNAVELPDGRSIAAELLLGLPDPCHSYAYCTDTRYTEALIPYIKGVTLLYHEATFLEELAKRAAETQHSTAQQAAQIAAKAGVERLLIGHFSARYADLTPLLTEARTIFAPTELAIEGKTYPVFLPT